MLQLADDVVERFPLKYLFGDGFPGAKHDFVACRGCRDGGEEVDCLVDPASVAPGKGIPLHTQCSLNWYLHASQSQSGMARCHASDLTQGFVREQDSQCHEPTHDCAPAT